MVPKPQTPFIEINVKLISHPAHKYILKQSILGVFEEIIYIKGYIRVDQLDRAVYQPISCKR